MQQRADISRPLTMAESASPNTNEPVASTKKLAIYSIALAAMPVLCLLSGLVIIPSNWFLERTNNTYMATMGYGVRLKGVNCDIVIYGDSSALAAVDPRIIKQRTGLSACNIAEFIGMTRVNGFIILDTYLRNNKPPKYFVFDFAPENLAEHKKWESSWQFEALMFRLRESPNLATFALLARHPADTMSFLETGLRLAVGGLMHKPFAPAERRLREQTNGYLYLPGAPLTKCQANDHDYTPEAGYVAALRRKYEAYGSTVLVDATPLPSCDSWISFYASKLAGITDDGEPAYPVSSYNGSGRLHMVPAGTQRFSNLVADQVLQRQESGH